MQPVQREPLKSLLGPANAVTLLRALLVVGVAGLVAAGTGPGGTGVLVGLATLALVLDAVDGQVARRTGTVTPFGARFDMEVDALLILVLSVDVAPKVGWWVLLIGAARYLLWAASLAFAWLRQASPPRQWAKWVAATQGVVLTGAASGWFPSDVVTAALAISLVLLTESFGRQVWWLWRHRYDVERPAGHRVRRVLASSVAGLVVWGALVFPDTPAGLSPAGFLRIPIEACVLLFVAVLVRGRTARVIAIGTGVGLGLVMVLKGLDVGFQEVFDRPFDPLTDVAYLGPGLGVLSDSSGQGAAVAAAVAAALLVAGALIVLPWALLRLQLLAQPRRRGVAITAAALAGVWCAAAAAGLQVAPGVDLASSSAATRAADVVVTLRADLRDRKTFAREIAADPYSDVPSGRLLRGLRGKDVLIVFMESYGRIAVHGASFSPEVDATLDAGTRTLAAAGYHARSAYLTSPTFGAGSWLAHSTLQSGLWVNSQQRYNQLLVSDRLTLADAFKRAGWRTVFDDPAITKPWPEGEAFYHFDQMYDVDNVGYQGPTFSYATMPDQYSLAAFRRLELATDDRPPVMAEIDLISSHHPWTPLPRMVPWQDVGDGSIYDPMPAEGLSPDVALRDPDVVRDLYGRSIVYSWRSLVSFLSTFSDPNLVVVVLGDHQPHGYVTGPHPGHDVPVSVISQDPRVLDRIGPWHWEPGLRPTPAAPVWAMSDFRDAFLTAFDAPR